MAVDCVLVLNCLEILSGFFLPSFTKKTWTGCTRNSNKNRRRITEKKRKDGKRWKRCILYIIERRVMIVKSPDIFSGFNALLYTAERRSYLQCSVVNKSLNRGRKSCAKMNPKFAGMVQKEFLEECFCIFAHLFFIIFCDIHCPVGTI